MRNRYGLVCIACPKLHFPVTVKYNSSFEEQKNVHRCPNWEDISQIFKKLVNKNTKNPDGCTIPCDFAEKALALLSTV